jgi:hypothetical protein
MNEATMRCGSLRSTPPQQQPGFIAASRLLRRARLRQRLQPPRLIAQRIRRISPR